MDLMMLVTPAVTAFTITVFYMLNKHDRLRIGKLLRSVGNGIAGAVHDILVTLGWVREPVRPPTLADLINERKKLRFMEMAEWDADFKRLLPPEPPRPQKGHDPDCRGMVEVDEYREISGFRHHVARIYQGHCRVCHWSGWITESQAEGYSDEWSVSPGKVMAIPEDDNDYPEMIRQEKLRTYEAQMAASKYRMNAFPPGYLEFKEEVRARGISPDPNTLATLQRQASETGYYPGPTDGVMGPVSMQSIIRYLDDYEGTHK